MDYSTSAFNAQFEQWEHHHPEILSSMGILLILLILAAICAIIVTIFSFLGLIRFARTGSMAEVFNFPRYGASSVGLAG
ncbi:MAG: DUF4013 domain-containing protein [Methanomicrobiales archaeon]